MQTPHSRLPMPMGPADYAYPVKPLLSVKGINQLQNKRIALIELAANRSGMLAGNYNGKAPYEIDPCTAFLQKTQNTSINVTYAFGCSINDTDESGFAAAIELARLSDIVIFVGGINQTIESNDRVNVTNTGDMAGSDVFLAFVTPPQQSVRDPSPPIKKLFGFQRVYLETSQTTEIYFSFNIRSLLTIVLDGSKWLEPGLHKIMVGKQHMHTIHLEGEPIRWSSF
ncbi:unnamed protein product [Didymodactylos carnosus]|uniref:Fibronectin type III-like domain-containing protein n=1 Tax=Didymodactylos carnosus TaxID=1234261 RepID=A0A815G984_9BILA|nr:unnamed protein product [Didymodactylos carnosus]CAF1335581.1 unnamed protein product [Didymodactylos carnosus]CAF3851866.1 unnamed protein product [Didymodactylos carnosus]CAF4192469.1 unnamed protein product [Didymodactylos carnosus]